MIQFVGNNSYAIFSFDNSVNTMDISSEKIQFKRKYENHDSPNYHVLEFSSYEVLNDDKLKDNNLDYAAGLLFAKIGQEEFRQISKEWNMSSWKGYGRVYEKMSHGISGKNNCIS